MEFRRFRRKTRGAEVGGRPPSATETEEWRMRGAVKTLVGLTLRRPQPL